MVSATPNASQPNMSCCLPSHLQELDGRLIVPALRQGQLEGHVLLRIAPFFIVYVHLHLAAAAAARILLVQDAKTNRETSYI